MSLNADFLLLVLRLSTEGVSASRMILTGWANLSLTWLFLLSKFGLICDEGRTLIIIVVSVIHAHVRLGVNIKCLFE